jgi:hypothetical protein
MIGVPAAHVGGVPIEETLGSLGPALLVGFGLAWAKFRARLRWVRSRATDPTARARRAPRGRAGQSEKQQRRRAGRERGAPRRGRARRPDREALAQRLPRECLQGVTLTARGRDPDVERAVRTQDALPTGHDTAGSVWTGSARPRSSTSERVGRACQTLARDEQRKRKSRPLLSRGRQHRREARVSLFDELATNPHDRRAAPVQA